MYFRALSNSTNTMSLNRGAAIQPGAYSSQAVFSNQGDVFSNSQKAEQVEQVASKPALKFTGWGKGLISLFQAMNTGAAAGKTTREFWNRHMEPPPKKHSSRRHKPRYETYEVDVYDRRGRYKYTEVRRRRIN